MFFEDSDGKAGSIPASWTDVAASLVASKCIMELTYLGRDKDGTKHGDQKLSSLRAHRALNPRPENVTDEAFRSGNSFFDCRDLVQVKYEMLRRVEVDRIPAKRAAAVFSFSRPSLYQAREA